MRKLAFAVLVGTFCIGTTNIYAQYTGFRNQQEEALYVQTEKRLLLDAQRRLTEENQKLRAQLQELGLEFVNTAGPDASDKPRVDHNQKYANQENLPIAAENRRLKVENQQMYDLLKKLGVQPATATAQGNCNDGSCSAGNENYTPQGTASNSRKPYLMTPQITNDINQFSEARQWASSMYQSDPNFRIVATNVTRDTQTVELTVKITLGYNLDVAYVLNGAQLHKKFYYKVRDRIKHGPNYKPAM